MEDGGAEVARAAAAAAEREEEGREREAIRATLERFIMLADTVEYESEEWAMLTQVLEAAPGEEWALLKQAAEAATVHLLLRRQGRRREVADRRLSEEELREEGMKQAIEAATVTHRSWM